MEKDEESEGRKRTLNPIKKYAFFIKYIDG